MGGGGGTFILAGDAVRCEKLPSCLVALDVFLNVLRFYFFLSAIKRLACPIAMVSKHFLYLC